MIITCEIGNTSTKLALYENEERLSLLIVDSKESTPFKSSILQMIYKLSLRGEQIEDAILTSSVTSLTPIVKNAIKEVINKEPHVIDRDNIYGIEVDEGVEGDVSTDLLITGAYAYQKFKQELIISSLGTSTVIFHITLDGKFKHYIIAPGYAGLGSAIYSSVTKLPDFSSVKKDSFLSTNPTEAMSIGVVEGYIGMVNHLITGMRKELGEQIRVICCGGAAKELSSYILNSGFYEADLVSDGLSYIYYRYIKHD